MPIDPPAASASRRYGTVAIALHWLLAVLIAGSFALGLYMTSLPFSPLQLKLYSWHKWSGITILALSALRLLWRLLRRPPPLPAQVTARTPGWQLVVRRWTYFVLYALFFVVPLLGWAYSSALGVPVALFGSMPLPDLLPVDKALAETLLKPLHNAGAYALAALAGLHAAAALKHRFVDHDGVFERMWAGRGEDSS
ncbi:MAG: cytochrome b/b6 domain-containing protein [Ramlibacter sp.]|nr:cytochrome b/b6 domain-containing protein [Ramlibacter sp.]